MDIIDIAIIGGGCAGLTAGIYAGRSELHTVIFTGLLEDKGGLLVKTSIVENFPGFPDGIMGYDLVTNMEQQAINCGAKLVETEIVSVDFSQPLKTLTDNTGKIYKAKAIIIATGSIPNKLHLKDEERLWSKGISSCAVCDGALYKRKKIVVVGGGDSAMEEALFLTKFSNVTLIHRGDSFPKASKVMKSRVVNNPKINIVYNTVIEEVNGSEFLETVKIKNIETKTVSTLEVDGLFYGLGLKPNTKIFTDIDKDENGYINHCNHNSAHHNSAHNAYDHHYVTLTSIDGVFVAGDAHDKVFRQAVVAAGDGCKAAMEAIDYLSKWE